MWGPVWTAGRVFAVLGAWLVGGVVAAGVAIGAGYNPVEHPAGLAITVIGQSAVAFVMVRRISRKWGTNSLATDVGLTFKRRDAAGILWGFGLQIGVALLVAPLIQFFAGEIDTQQQVADLAESTGDAGGRVALLVTFVIVAPFIEEVMFRGAMLGWLAGVMTMRWAVVIQAAAFAGVHLADPSARFAVPGLFLIGLALGWAAQRRRSLSLPIFLHAGVNLTGAVFLFWGGDIIDEFERLEEAVAIVGSLMGIR
jgi:membrane protease YdiL (CAAX protease family)